MASNECILKNTYVTIDNKATVGTLKLVKFHLFINSKNIEIPFPLEIPAGKSATIKYPGPVGAAVVYRFGPPPEWLEEYCDWMMSWEPTGKVYTEIMEKDHYDNPHVWLEIRKRLEHGTKHSDAHWGDCSATVNACKDKVQGEFRANNVST